MFTTKITVEFGILLIVIGRTFQFVPYTVTNYSPSDRNDKFTFNLDYINTILFNFRSII